MNAHRCSIPRRSASLLLALLVALLTGCHRSVLTPEEDARTTCLRISMTAPYPRAQGDRPSIQTDMEDREDFVDEVALLVYEAAGEEEKSPLVAKHFSRLPNFVLEMTVKKDAKYHFCFVANYSAAMRATLEGAATYSALKSLLQSYEDFDLYNGVGDKGFFPMARIYESQQVPEGGSLTRPTPFQPTTTAEGSLAPISSRGTTEEIGTTQAWVNLIRTCAKVSVSLTGDGAGEVAKLELHNAASQQSLMENGTALPGLASEAKEISLTNGMGKIYLPERLLGKATPGELGWDTATDKQVGSPTYLALTMTSGSVYKIPVITADATEIPSQEQGGYLSLARSDEADFSIIRNRHYHYRITVPQDSKELTVRYDVLPWDLMESVFSYAQPKYRFTLAVVDTLSQSRIKYSQQMQQVQLPPHCVVEIAFEITQPEGNAWVASITNGLDFEITGSSSGIVRPGALATSYTMRIVPKGKTITDAKYTQFYISVEGRELNLAPGKEAYLGDDATGRWEIKRTLN